MTDIHPQDKLAALDWAVRLAENACMKGSAEPQVEARLQTLRAMRDELRIAK